MLNDNLTSMNSYCLYKKALVTGKKHHGQHEGARGREVSVSAGKRTTYPPWWGRSCRGNSKQTGAFFAKKHTFLSFYFVIPV